nr:caspase family protein [Azospirillum oleiclasticum]
MLIAFLCVVSALWLPSAATAGDRVALVVGNGDYRHATPLLNPPNDAKLMASTLDDAGFDLIGGKPLIDLSREDLEKAVREFGQRIRGASAAVFFYAGHGIQMNGTNYLVPVTAKVASEADVRYELVDVGLVLDAMDGNDRRMNIVVLDACRNNPFGGRGMRSASSGLAQMQAPAGTVIGYATQPGALAADGDGRNSPYTAALAEAMRRPGSTVFDVFNNVGVQVMRKTGGSQQPWFSTSPLDGEFHFFAPTGAAKPPPPGPAADREVAFWNSIKDSADPTLFKAYLEQFPGGTFRSLAESRLRTLTPIPAAPQPATPVPAPAPAAPQVAGTVAPPVLPGKPPSAGSMLFDASAVPYVKPAARETLSRYASAPSPKAFAVATNGSYAYVTSANGPLPPSRVARAALERCEFLAGRRCALYAVDDRLVVPPGTPLRLADFEIEKEGAVNPATVPFLTRADAFAAMGVYAGKSESKALALHWRGAYGYATGRKTEDEAREAALEYCAKHEPEGCFIYAVDDEIVWEVP